MKSRIPKAYVAAAATGVAAVVLAWTMQGRIRTVSPGSPAPAFAAPSLSGELVSLSDYGGQVVLLNVWATWCLPCREEMPSMERLYQKMRSEGAPFEIVAVSIDAAPGGEDARGNVGGDLQAFADSYGLTFTILHDPEGSIQRIYQTTGVPESFLIDKNGIIRKRMAGAAEWDSPGHEEYVRRLVSE